MSQTREGRFGDNLLVRDEASELHFIPIEEVLRAEAEAGASTVHLTGGRHYATRRSMDEMESLLGADFLRVSRSTLVSIRAVRKMSPRTDGRLDVRLIDGSSVIVSRSRSIALRRSVL